MTQKLAYYGAIKDPLDHRDYHYSPADPGAQLPHEVDLRPECPIVHEQGHPLTCTAHAIAGAFQVEQRRLGLEDFSPSRLFIFYNTIALMQAQHQDGANLRAGLKAVARQGVCPEKDWPFSLRQSVMDTRPSHYAYEIAEHHKILRYESIVRGGRSEDQLLHVLKYRLAEGFPFMFAFQAYKSFESEHVAQTGIMHMPRDKEEAMGWHAVMAVGYEDQHKRILVRNSWGWSWGIKGYFWMPYEYIVDSKIADNFWVMRGVTPEMEESASKS